MEARGKSFSIVILIFFIIFLLWAVFQFISPFNIPENSVKDLSGIIGVIDNQEITSDMSFPWSSVYGCGDSLCHQRDDRSFFINGNQMPFCSRCTAIWLGLAIGLGFMVFFKIELNSKLLILIFIGLIPISVDGLGQLFGLWESSNIARVITGLLIGIVCGIAIGVIIDEIRVIISIRTKNN
jgi:uncharacterized membrane protein